MLDVKNLNISRSHRSHSCKECLIRTPRGEVLAVAGVQGNGQSELAEAIVGLQEHIHGRITLDGEDITKSSKFAMRFMQESHLSLNHAKKMAYLII